MSGNGSDALQPLITVVPATELGFAGKARIISLCSEALAVDCGSLFDHLSASTHVLANVDGQLVGHACWTARRLQPAGLAALGTAWVDAVTVAPSLQKRGIGTLVMRRLATLIASFDLGALGTEQMPFFERLRWERWKGPLARGVLHDPLDTLMILRMPTTPDLDRSVTIAAR